MSSTRAPSRLWTTLVVVVLALGWGSLRLFVFDGTVFPLTFVLPLLVAVWTRRHWQLWSMAVVFLAMAFAKAFWVLPNHVIAGEVTFFVAMVINILVGATVVHLIIDLRARLEERNATILAQNAELEAQAEELLQQNEEIKVQSEELAQQNEEIESQTEELSRQNEELQEANVRLSSREEILQGLLRASRTPEHGTRVLHELCARSVPILGRPAEAIAYLEADGDSLRLRAHASGSTAIGWPERWPLKRTLGERVLQEDRTAYVFDFHERTDLATPFGQDGPVRTMLATPVRIGGRPGGLLLACGREPSHWTEDQFKMIEWLAAQCGLIAEGLSWQYALTDRSREVEAASRAKDQFIAMLSHELRTPLTPVLAAAGALEEDDRLPEDVREDLRMIRRNVGIQSRLIDDLLDLTRIGQGKIDLACETLRLDALLEQTAAIVAADLDAKDQALDLAIEAVRDRHVVGDGPRLQQVFWNLLKNAIKFSPPKARITLKAVVLDGEPLRVAIHIADQGAGIAAKDLARIFLPFEQATTEGKQRGSDAGLGLGLAIAKAIVELHRGTIHAASDGVGRGATFTVHLPLNRAVEKPASNTPFTSNAPARSASPSGRGLRILLVEDHVDTGRVIARLLRNAGHVVEYADTAGAALALFERNDFDLIVSDLGLPDMSGLDLMRKFSARRPGLPGICLSGYGMEDDLVACREAGFTEHLTKPVDIQRLRAVISRIAAADPV